MGGSEFAVLQNIDGLIQKPSIIIFGWPEKWKLISAIISAKKLNIAEINYNILIFIRN